MPIAKEGIPFIAIPLILSILFFIFSIKSLAIFLLIVSLFMTFFFRDPLRKSPFKENVVLSPADGKIIEIKDGEDEIFPGKELFKISIFMSPLNVHINRAPLKGKVEKVIYRPGYFKPAYKEESKRNEQNIILMETARGKVIIKQIAGIIARRVVCSLKKSQEVKAGEKIGMIIFGSRVELFLAEKPNLKVKVGEKVKGGETIIGEFYD